MIVKKRYEQKDEKGNKIKRNVKGKLKERRHKGQVKVKDEDVLMSVSADRFEGWVFLTEMKFLSPSPLTGDR